MFSPRKASSALSSIAEEKGKMNPNTSKSCESLYSSSSKGSANIIYNRKAANAVVNSKINLFRGPRQATIIPATNEVRQRVLSARRLRMKTYQNQLADAQQTIAELAHENRVLRTLHKRQDSALSKYESTNAELPQLLHSHAEELRMWQTKHRNLQVANKELEQKLKQKESVILSLSDQNKYYIQLNKDKNLEDRQRLTEKLHLLEARLQEKDNDIKMTARKMQLEAKQFKQQLQMEQKNNREILVKLEKARLELSGYRKIEEFQSQEKFNLNLRRNKGPNNVSTKEETDNDKHSLTNITEAEVTDEIAVLNSQRSSHSSDSMVQRNHHAIKSLTTKHHSPLSPSTVLMQHITKPQMQPSKTIAALKRIDQGDGDSSAVNGICKTNKSFSGSLVQKQDPNLSSVTQSQQENVEENNYEDDYYENDIVDELEKTEECEENLSDNQCADTDENRENGSKIDYYGECKNVENSNSGKKTRMKEEISSIRKQISDDYKEREAFLDTFCRQATNGVLCDEAEKKRSITVAKRNMSGNRKHKLLAALKAIDDNKSQD